MVTIDAQGKTLGRVAAAAAKALLGKHGVSFAKHTVHAEEVKVINASKVALSGNKTRVKQYVRYSGYPGGQKIETYKELTNRRGHTEAIRRAVRGMLPKNKLQDLRLKNLIIEK